LQTAQLAATRAQLLNASGRFAEAACAAARAIELNPMQMDARFAQGFALYMLEQLSEAQTALDALIALEPGYPNAAWLRAGLLRRMRGDQDPAVPAAYDLAARVDPTNLYIRVERADILRSLGRYEDAQAIYGAVISASDDEALRIEATFKQGCVALVLNNPADARIAFRAVLDSAPDYPEAREMVEMLS
jgi:tetratricopeptide (TPR) repeat protein